MIYITDYIQNFDLEKKIIGKKLINFKEDFEKRFSAKVLLVWHFEINELSLKDFPELHSIVRYGVGVDNIDLEFCKKKGIKVFNNPDYGVDEVSDSAIAMIMSLSRNITRYNSIAKKLLRSPNPKYPWQENTEISSMRLKDSSIGIIGAGRIGSSVALKMKNIIGSINFYDPYVSSGYEKVIGANRFESLESLLQNSQIVSVHVPLTKETSGMINRSFIKMMSKESILINTSRGGIIDSLDCLYEGMMSKNISGLGLDVLPEEPPSLISKEKLLTSWLDENHALKDRIIINPHTSYFSPQSYKEMRLKASKMSLKALKENLFYNQII